MGEQKCFYGNAWLWLTIVEARGWSGHTFAPSASLRALTKILAMSPSFAVHGRPHDTNTGMWHSSRCCQRHSWLTQFGALFLEPACSLPVTLSVGPIYIDENSEVCGLIKHLLRTVFIGESFVLLFLLFLGFFSRLLFPVFFVISWFAWGVFFPTEECQAFPIFCPLLIFLM